MKTASICSAFALLVVVNSAIAQRRCCRVRVCCPCPPVYVEPTCGLPSYAGPTLTTTFPMVATSTSTSATTQSNVTAALAPTPAASPTSSATTPSVAPVHTTPATAPTATKIPIEAIVSPSDGVADDDLATSDDDKKWRSLFNGKELGDWEITKFGGEGEVAVEKGHIFCDFGQYITGVTYKGKNLPTNNYEIELEAQRVDGQDFFCGLTFPVDKTHATFVCGGWGGSVTGISSIDSYDASENDTTDYMEFKNKKWYKIRVRVTKDVLEAWIDDKKMVNKDVESSRLSTRLEVDPSKPLGMCCFDSQAAYRNIRIRDVTGPASKGTKK